MQRIITFRRPDFAVPKISEVYGKDAFSFREQSIVVTIPFERIHNPQTELGNKKGNNSLLNERRRMGNIRRPWHDEGIYPAY